MLACTIVSRARKILLFLKLDLSSADTTEDKLQEIAREKSIDTFQDELVPALHRQLVNGTAQQLRTTVQNSSLNIDLVIDVTNNNYTIGRALSGLSNGFLLLRYNGSVYQSSPVSVQNSTTVNDSECEDYITLNELEYQHSDNKTLLLTASSQLLQKSEIIYHLQWQWSRLQ